MSRLFNTLSQEIAARMAEQLHALACAAPAIIAAEDLASLLQDNSITAAARGQISASNIHVSVHASAYPAQVIDALQYTRVKHQLIDSAPTNGRVEAAIIDAIYKGEQVQIYATRPHQTVNGRVIPMTHQSLYAEPEAA